jgi:hypothetical protein
VAVSTDEIDTALDGINIAVTGLFRERVESITKTHSGAATIAENSSVELRALIKTHFDTVRTRHALLREKLDSTVAAAQDASVAEFLTGVDAIELPLSGPELDTKLKTLLDTTTEKVSKSVLALVHSVTLQQELPSFKSAVSAQAFAKLEAVTRAIVQHRTANDRQAELKQQQEAKAAADVAATQAKAAAAKAVADAAQAQADAAQQLAAQKRIAAQRQREQDEELQAERAQAVAELQRVQRQQRLLEEQQQQQQQQRSQRYEEDRSTGGYSAYDDCRGSEQFSSSSSASGPLKRDGTPDMRYKANWNTNNQGQYININGSVKQSSYSGSSHSSGGGGGRASGPLKKDGTPDMRYKANW